MSGLYANYKALALGGGVHTFVDLPVDEIRVAILNESTDYTTADSYATELAGHQDYDDVNVGNRHLCYNGDTTEILTSGNITTTDGVFDHTTNITFANVSLDGAKNVDVLVLAGLLE